jgi:hypothetical protein
MLDFHISFVVHSVGYWYVGGNFRHTTDDEFSYYREAFLKASIELSTTVPSSNCQ